MNLKRLTIAEMVAISGAWVAPKSKARAALEGIPLVAPFFTHLVEAHRALVETQPSSEGTVKLTEISEKEASVDADHDDCVRAIDLILSGFALCASSPEKSVELQHIRSILLPDGLSIVQRSYRDEAGQADLLDKRLDASTKAKLKKLPIPGGNMLELVERWMGYARELGELESQRALLAQSCLGKASAATAVAARNGWIRSVTALLSLLGFANIDSETKDMLLGSLRDAEGRAARRIPKAEVGEVPPEDPPVKPSPS